MKITLDDNRIREFCHRHQIRRMAFFGSILREDFRPDSDVDVLVEFARGSEPGMLAISSMERELSEILGRKADLRTPEDLSRYFRDDVISAAENVYAA